MDTVETVSTTRTRLVLLGQGSNDPRWQKPFVQLWLKLQETMGEKQVGLAFLEHATPSLAQAGQEAVADQVGRLVILPLFLGLSTTLEQEIPLQVVELKQLCPDLDVVLLPPIGEHPLVSEAIVKVAEASINFKLPNVT